VHIGGPYSRCAAKRAIAVGTIEANPHRPVAPSLDTRTPDIVETILNGRQSAQMTLAVLMRPFAVEWTEQARILRS
jgi:hypothetical protein